MTSPLDVTPLAIRGPALSFVMIALLFGDEGAVRERVTRAGRSPGPGQMQPSVSRSPAAIAALQGVGRTALEARWSGQLLLKRQDLGSCAPDLPCKGFALSEA